MDLTYKVVFEPDLESLAAIEQALNKVQGQDSAKTKEFAEQTAEALKQLIDAANELNKAQQTSTASAEEYALKMKLMQESIITTSDGLKQATDEVNSATVSAAGANNEYISKLGETQMAINDKRAELAKLNAEMKEEGGNTVQNAEKQAILKGEVTELSKELRAQQSAYIANKEAAEQTGQTYAGLVASNRRLQNEMRNVPLDDTTGKLKRLQAEYKANNDTLIKFDEKLGNHQRKVGDYKNQLAGLGGAITSSGGSIGQFANAFSGLNMVFKANPIGAVVALFGYLISALNSVQGVTDSVNVALKFMNGVLTEIGGIIFELGKKMFSAFSDPKKAISDLWEFIKTNFVNRLEGLMELLPALGRSFKLAFSDPTAAAKIAADAFLKVTTGVEGMTDKIADAIETTKELTDRVLENGKRMGQAEIDAKNLRLAISGLKVAEAELGAQIAENRLIAQDESKSIESRSKAIKNAILFTRQLAAERAKVAEEDLRIARERLAADKTDITRFEAVAEAEAKLINIRRQAADEERGLLRQKKAVEGQEMAQIAAARKAAETELQIAADTAKKKAVIAQQANIKALDDEIELAKAAGDAGLQNQLISLRAQEQARLEAIQSAAVSESEIEKLTAEKLTEIRLAEQQRRDVMLLHADSAAQKAREQQEVQALLNAGKTFEALALQRQQALDEVRKNALLAGITDEEQIKRLQAEKEIQFETQKEKAITDIKKKEIATRNQAIAASIAFATNVGALIFGESKGFAIASALMNTYLGASAAYAQTPGGVIIKSLAAAAATAQGLKNVQMIRKQNLKGGGGGGGSGGGGGISSFSSPSQTQAQNVAETQMQARQFASNQGNMMAERQNVFVVQANLDRRGLAVSVNEGQNIIRQESEVIRSNG